MWCFKLAAGLALCWLCAASPAPAAAAAPPGDDPSQRGRHSFSVPPARTEDKDFWNEDAQSELERSLRMNLNTNRARNVILFLGDGMGVSTVTASRIYKGQVHNESGEEQQLLFETFPHVALSKTYSVDKQVSDSASTATAYLAGVKTNQDTVGVDGSARLGDCSSVNDDNKVHSIAKWALDAGKRAGVVTSTRITHATPAAVYAHSASRDWECDAEFTPAMLATCSDLKDIARQLVEDDPGRRLNVIMGGGYQYLSSSATNRTGDPVDREECYRRDGRDLFLQWQEDKQAQSKTFKAVRTKSELMEENLDNVEYLFGVFANVHLPWEYESAVLQLDVPTLAEMTKKALELLTAGENGFFLLVEGGRIDHAHHDGTARKALQETLAFEDAIRTALSIVDTEETLVVVTADHSHVMTINGYPDRGHEITGFGGLGQDELPYTTLMYTNGNGFNYTAVNGTVGARWNISGDDVSDYEYLQLSAVPRSSETHGGEDVAIYALGPMSHLFHGVHEQNYIAHVMGYAACIGANQRHCDNPSSATHQAQPAQLWAVATVVMLAQALSYHVCR